MNRTTSRILIAALTLLVLLGAALAAGCASAPSGSAATKIPTSAGTAAVTTAGSSTGSGAPAVGAVGYARLLPFVPKSAGAWKLESDPMGMTGKDADGKEYSWVTGVYQKSGDDTVQGSVQIHDLATAESPLKGMWQGFSAYESTEGYMKSTTIKGSPAWDIHDKNSKSYSMMIGVGERYLVFVTVEDGTKADLDTIVNAVDIAGIAAVK